MNPAHTDHGAHERGLLLEVLGLKKHFPITKGFMSREVARRFGVAYRGPADLYDPVRNLTLGIAHLVVARRK